MSFIPDPQIGPVNTADVGFQPRSSDAIPLGTGTPSDATPLGGSTPPTSNPVKELLGPSIWDQIGAHDAYVADSIAKQKMGRGIAEGVVNTAMQTGQTVDQQDDARMQSQIAPIAGQLAQATAGMPDHQFQALVSHVSNALTGQFHPNNTLGPDSAVPAASPTILDQVPPPQGVGPTPVTPPPALTPPVNQDNTDYQNAIQNVQSAMANPPQVPTEPALQSPNWLQAAFTAVAALSSPRFAADTSAAMFQGIHNEHDADWQKSVANYQLRAQAYNQNIAHQQALAGMIANFQSHKLAVQQHMLQLQQQGDYKHSADLNRATAIYDAAQNYQDKLVAAHNYNSLLRPDEEKLAITDNMARSAGALHSFGTAAKEFQNSMSQVAKFGEVTDSNAKDLANQRLQIALRYGIANPNDPDAKQQQDAASLGPILTGKSYRSMALEERRDALNASMQRFNVTLDFQRDKWADQMANKQADYDLSVKKLQDFEQWRTSEYALSYDRVALERQSLKLRTDIANAAQDVKATGQIAIRKLTNETIPGITGQITVLQAIKSPSKEQQKQLSDAQNELAKANGQLQGLTTAQQPTVDLPPEMGGGQAPNPSYQAPASVGNGQVPQGAAPATLPGSTFQPAAHADPDLVNRQRKVAALSQQFQSQFGGRFEIPSGSNRNIQGTNTPSLHNVNAATDLYPGNPKNLPSVADWATKQPGVQTVIFDRRVWTPAKGWHDYSSAGDPHTDHVHVDYGRPGSMAQSVTGKTKSGVTYSFTPH